MRDENEAPRMYLSHDAHGWRVILDGVPVTADRDEERTRQTYAFCRGLKGPAVPMIWDGERGEWSTPAPIGGAR